MKNLVIPGPVTLVNDDGVAYQRAKKGATQPTPAEQRAGALPIFEDDEYTFWSWLRTYVLVDEKFNTGGWDMWEQIGRINHLKGLPEGSAPLVDDDDIKLMTEIAKKPSKPCYQDGTVAVQFSTFIRELITANDSKPAKPVVKVESTVEEEVVETDAEEAA